MKRWNGWGDGATVYPLAPSAEDYLVAAVGPGERIPDAALEAALANVPPGRLPAHPLVTVDAEERLRHARGQSLPDWVALRSGQIGAYPDGVAYPTTPKEVRDLLAYARSAGARVIPYGGGSSVVGGVDPRPGDAPVLTLDLARMDQLLALDEASRTATFEAGIPGPQIERLLGARGFTLGHFPQSFEFSTLGGWIATRSVGQQSYRYGRIDQTFIGGEVETPRGTLLLADVPASAAGPDLRHAVLGSEGRLGVITRASVRIRRRPERESFHAAFFPDWAAGTAAVRAMAQAELRLSMLRLADATETATTLALSGKPRLVGLAERGLGLIGQGPERCLLIFGVSGERDEAWRAYRQAVAIARHHRGFIVNVVIGEMWRKTRFLTPYLRNTLWERGYALDTLETALPWSRVLPALEEIKAGLRAALEGRGERALVFSHLSHLYPQGSSLYVTYLWRRSRDPEETLDRWRAMKAGASRTIQQHGGTISHQHGVGSDHAAYLPAEKGVLGMELVASMCRVLDPEGMMNPGKLTG